jgi:dipeptidase D
LETVDEVGNVIIKKPLLQEWKTVNRCFAIASGYGLPKNNDVNFDFETEGIKMEIDGDWVKAKGTTLGADNGLGVATIMSILESSDIPHPALEALFTIDEETGMTGALG